MFKPLDMLRRIRDDQDLTTTEVAILMCAIGRTDNNLGRIKGVGQIELAQDAKVSVRTMKNFYASETFQRYFTTEKRGRWLLLYWRQVQPQVQEVHLIGAGDAPHLLTSATSTNSYLSEELEREEVVASTDSGQVQQMHLSPEERIRLADLEAQEMLRKKLAG